MTKSPTMDAIGEEATTTTTTKKAPAKKPAAKKAPAKKAADTVEGDLIAVTAAKIENLTGAQAIESVSDMQEKLGENTFYLGGLLAKISEEEAWKLAGHETFKAYIEAELGIKYRKAMYLQNIYTSLVNSGVSWDQVESLGWTKLSEICTLITKKNVKTWVKRAEGMTVLQLQQYIRSLKETDGDEGLPSPKSDVSTLTFKVHADQKELILSTLETVKAQANTEFDSVALQYLCEQTTGTTGKEASDLPQTEAEWVAFYKEQGAMAILTIFEKAFPDVTVEVTGDVS